jgi:signal transduction histidine kinase
MNDPANPDAVVLVRSDGTIGAVEGIPLRRTIVRSRDLAIRVLEVFATQARSARLSLTVKQSDQLPATIHGDEEKLAWALVTLVGNALRVVSQPSRADVDPRVELHVDFDPADDSFVFVVSDNGPGMPESTAKWLFERDPHTGRAVGLGLLMVKDVAAAHGGSIEVTSRLGHGAQFRLRVPRGERLGHLASTRPGY